MAGGDGLAAALFWLGIVGGGVLVATVGCIDVEAIEFLESNMLIRVH
jgi:hypothetical protein